MVGDNSSPNKAPVANYSSSPGSFFVKQPVQNNSFNYLSLCIGVGLIVTGGILMYICEVQSQYTHDLYSSGLQVTGIFFSILGSLLILTSFVKIVASRTNPEKTCIPCCLDVVVENGIKQLPPTYDNTILYDPLYPPILIPYGADGIKDMGKKFYSQYMPDSNFPEKQLLEEGMDKTKSDVYVVGEQNVENNEDCNCYEENQLKYLKEESPLSAKECKEKY